MKRKNKNGALNKSLARLYADGEPQSGTPRYTDRQVIAVYKRSTGLRAAGAALGLTHTRVHQIMVRAAPELLRRRGQQPG